MSGLFVLIADDARAMRPTKVLASDVAVAADVAPSGVSGSPRPLIVCVNVFVSAVTRCAASDAVAAGSFGLTLARALSSVVTHVLAAPQ